MENNILVAYSTVSGSTEMVAQVIGERLGDAETNVEVREIGEIPDLRGYSAVVLGGPMILGWHRKTRVFMKKHRNALAQIPTALFFSSMQVTVEEKYAPDFSVYIDPKVELSPKSKGHLSFKEKKTTLTSYFKPLKKLFSAVQPVGAAFFAGKLDYRELKFPQMLFVMLVIQAKPGDFRSREKIQNWAGEIKPLLVR